MFTHNLDPILIEFGFLSIRWYSLSYIFGILLGWHYGRVIIKNRFNIVGEKFKIQEFDDLITYIIISIIIGGRLGYVIFYNFNYFINYPLDIIKIWEGGMSFHGALIGIIFGTYIFSIKKKIQTFFLLDIISCVAPIGIFLGRIANFINGELVGKITNMPWGVVFPLIDTFPRHPSQLYEAFFEGFLIFFIMRVIFNKKNYKIGTCSYMFLIIYGIFRIFSEFFREPDIHLGYYFGFFSMGTILSAMMILIGIIIFYFLNKNEN